MSETGKGRIAQVHGDGSVSSLAAGLLQPKGLALQDKRLLVLDHGTQELHAIELATNKPQVLASQLPIGEPDGLSRCPMDFLGGIATSIDGTIYNAADGEGSVLTLHKA